MEKRIKFSIIVPTYNRAQLIARSIKSVINQTYKDFELIVIDDGSVDNTLEIINLFSDHRLVYKRLPENRGCNAARNLGLDLTRGEYIVFLDSDDELLTDALENFHNIWSQVKDNKIGNVVTRCIDSKNKLKMGYLEKDNLILQYQDIVCRKKAWGEFLSCWRSDIIEKMRFPEKISTQDSIFWFRLAKKCDFLYRDIITKIYYRDSILNLSSIERQIKNAPKLAKGVEILLDEHAETWKRLCPDCYITHLKSAAFFNLLAGNKRHSRKWTKKIILQETFILLGWGLYLLSFFPHTMIIILIKLRKEIIGTNRSLR